ncbi:MAG: amidase [Candidatus Dormibacteraeota bacterium]|nr:amidase [Candidatus Dormibacteraeota bacterium]
MNADESRARIRTDWDDHAFISLTEEEGAGPAVGIKDLVDVRGTVTTAGATLLGDRPATEDAPVVERIRASGAVVVGKTNLHEFAFGLTSENPHYGVVQNPRAPGRVAGGSSGGSAAAVAAQLCDWALGTDTGGSIRVPAALCGVVGIKPTIGTVETQGVFPLSPTLDTVGPLAPDVRTAAAALEAMSELEDLVPSTVRPLDFYRIGVPEDWALDLGPGVREAWDRVAGALTRVPFPEQQALVDTGAAILNVEAAALHRRWLASAPDHYGADVRQRLEEAARMPRTDLVAALGSQALLRVDVEAALADLDALLVPATRIVAPRVGEPFDRFDLSGFTRPFNTSGHPVVCLPAPVPEGALPVGIQVVGHFGHERELLEVARALEAAWAR